MKFYFLLGSVTDQKLWGERVRIVIVFDELFYYDVLFSIIVFIVFSIIFPRHGFLLPIFSF